MLFGLDVFAHTSFAFVGGGAQDVFLWYEVCQSSDDWTEEQISMDSWVETSKDSSPWISQSESLDSWSSASVSVDSWNTIEREETSIKRC